MMKNSLPFVILFLVYPTMQSFLIDVHTEINENANGDRTNCRTEGQTKLMILENSQEGPNAIPLVMFCLLT